MKVIVLLVSLQPVTDMTQSDQSTLPFRSAQTPARPQCDSICDVMPHERCQKRIVGPCQHMRR